MKFKKLSLLLLGGILLAGCSKASAIELSVVPNQSMVTGKAIVIDVKTEPVISIDPNSIEISGGESWVENGVIKFKASEPGQYTMKVTQDNVTSNTITIPLDTSSAIAKNETQSISKSSNSTTSKSSTQSSTKQNGTTNNQTNTNPTVNQGQTNPSNQTPTQNTTPPTPSGPTTPTTPSSDPTLNTPAITPDPEPNVPEMVAPSEDPTLVVDAPSAEEETPSVEETPVPDPTPSLEDDPASTVQDTSMSVDQVYEDQSELIAHKTPITVNGILPEALVSNGSGKEEQVLWNEELKEYLILEGFTIPFGGCNAQVSGTLSRNAKGQLVLNMTYISTDDVPKTGGTGYHDVTSSTQSTTDEANASSIDRNNPTPHPEPGTGQ